MPTRPNLASQHRHSGRARKTNKTVDIWRQSSVGVGVTEFVLCLFYFCCDNTEYVVRHILRRIRRLLSTTVTLQLFFPSGKHRLPVLVPVDPAVFDKSRWRIV